MGTDMTVRQRAQAVIADAAATFDVKVADMLRIRLVAEEVAARRYANRMLMQNIPRLTARQRARYLNVNTNTVQKWSAK